MEPTLFSFAAVKRMTVEDIPATACGDEPRAVMGYHAAPVSGRETGTIWHGLRGYQGTACDKIATALATFRATLLVMATGLGKTITAAAFVRAWKSPHTLWPNSVLWLAHRDELISQARAQLEALTGEPVSVEQAQSVGGGTRIVVASIQTLRGKRLTNWAKDRFQLIVIDEAHHAPNKSYTNILDHFLDAKVLGLTATPDRLDGKAAGTIFGSVAAKYDIDFGIREGYLVPLHMEDCHVDSIDIGRARTVMGDVDESTVEEEIAKAVGPIAQAVRECTPPGARSLTFTPRVGSAHAVSDALNAHSAESSFCVDGTTDKRIRRSILESHRAGKFPHLLNCQVFTEGYDDPGVRVGVIARMTKSRSLYVQMLGRILRPLKGIGELPTREARLAAIAASEKPHALVLDISGNAGKHQLISPVDVLGGSYDADEVQRAKKLLKAKGGSVDEALKKAREEKRAKEMAARKRAGERAAAAKIKLTRKAIDPFAVLGTHDSADDRGNPADPKQLMYLAEAGVDIPPGCSYGQAAKLVSMVKHRRAAGLCSYKQARLLRKKGFSTDKMTKRKASELIDAFVGHNWHPPQSLLDYIVSKERQPGEDG
jgi:superfamily II DNA or RNA helicase